MAQASFGTRTATAGATTQADVEVVGRRVLATLVDAVVLTVLTLVVFAAQWVIGLIFLGASGGVGLSEGAQLAVVLVVGLLNVVVILALLFGYYVYPEGRKGQTVGKMVVGIKVIREDTGGAPGTRAALVRTLLRLVDGFFGYLVGYLAVASSKKRQRLGDMAAHTLVVRATGTNQVRHARNHSRLRHHGDLFDDDLLDDEDDFGTEDDEVGGGWGDGDPGGDFDDSGGGDT